MTNIELQGLLIVTSITIGIGLTKMFEGLALSIRNKDFDLDIVYAMWYLIVFILNVEFVWNIRLQTEMQLTLLRLSIYMLGPIFLFLSSNFFVLKVDGDSDELTFDYFIENRRYFFVPLAMYMASQIVVSVLIKAESLTFTQNYFRYASLIILLIALISKNRYVHIVIAAIACITLLLYILTTDLMT